MVYITLAWLPATPGCDNIAQDPLSIPEILDFKTHRAPFQKSPALASLLCIWLLLKYLIFFKKIKEAL